MKIFKKILRETLVGILTAYALNCCDKAKEKSSSDVSAIGDAKIVQTVKNQYLERYYLEGDTIPEAEKKIFVDDGSCIVIEE